MAEADRVSPGAAPLGADRQEGDDAGAGPALGERLQLLLERVVADVERVVAAFAQRLVETVQMDDHRDLAGRPRLRLLRDQGDRPPAEALAGTRGVVERGVVGRRVRLARSL